MKFRNTRKALSVVSSLIFTTLITGTIIADHNFDTISSTLNQKTFEIVTDSNDNTEDTEYYKSAYTKLGDAITNGRNKAVEVEQEGAVLLKNDNNALPLSKGNKVSLVGVTSYDPVYGGTGSGSISKDEAVDFNSSLTNAGLEVNPVLKESYESADWAQYKRSSTGRYGNTIVKINEAPWSVVSEVAGDSLSTYGDAAIFTVGRVGGEGYDLCHFDGDGIDNGDGLGPDYLGLNANEKTVIDGLKELKAAGKIKKIIILVNYASMIEGDFLKDDAIDAAMWIGTPGLGNNAVGKLLVGDVNPSGRLSDTMWMDNAMNPVNVNYGTHIYQDAEKYGISTMIGGGMYPESTLSAYTVYQEGMYLGYKYTETRYEDSVLETANVGNYDYDKVVAYPFGYGLNYGSFSYDDVSMKKKNDRTYEVSVKVKNDSTAYSGKYSVPVYISKPYTDYARKNQIQVPSVELIDFAKTKILAPGESEILTIDLDEKYFTSYDSNGAKGYVLMDGNYYVCVGGSSHEAVNNLLAKKEADGIRVDSSKIVGESGNANDVCNVHLSFDKDKYAYSDVVSALDGKTNMQITNEFDFCDMNKYEGKGDNSVSYYSRDNWDDVSLDMTNGYVKLKMTDKLAQDIYAQVPEQTGNYNNAPSVPSNYKQPIPTDDGDYPTYGKDAGLKLINMKYDSEGKEIGFFDSAWDDFMDQLTWEDTVNLVSDGFHLTEACETIAKPATSDQNGPNGFNFWFGGYGSSTNGLAYRTEVKDNHVDSSGKYTSDADENLNRKPTGFPSNGIIASSLNKTLAHDEGNAIGEDGLWSGCSGLYGLGMNIHRSPYLGRTCEYYSEDGMLTGLIGAYETKGIEEKGVHVYNKHCALNDQEDNRHGVGCWLSEQTLRETYLRAFELPITIGGAFNTMASFSRFGAFAAGACPELSETFLRGECGMKGIIVTDAYGDMDGSQNCDPYFEQVYSCYVGGSDIPDGSTPKTNSQFEKYKTGYSKMANQMRLSAKRICYQTLWSNAMNGISSSATIVKIMPQWQKLLVTADVTVGVITAGSLSWTLLALLLEAKKKRINN